MQGEMTKDQYINRHSRRLRIRYSIYNNEFQIYLRILFLQTAVFIFINKPLRIVSSIIIFNAIRKKKLSEALVIILSNQTTKHGNFPYIYLITNLKM